MRPSTETSQRAGGPITSSGVPLRLFSRLPLPADLAREIGASLEDSGGPGDTLFRESIVLRTRVALEAWLDGAATTSETVHALRLARGR